MTTKHTLCGLAEAAALLNVSDSRVNQISKNDKDFPEKLDQLRCGPIWLWADMARFAENRQARLAAIEAAKEALREQVERVQQVPEMVPGQPVEQP